MIRMDLKLLALASLPLLAACGQAEDEELLTACDEDEPEAAAAIDPVEMPEAMAALLDAEFADFSQRYYRSGLADLNGDGEDEWLVFVAGPGVCGTGGCPLRIFQQTADGIETKGQLSVVQMPVGVFESETEGWRDLAITVGGGGIDYTLAKVPYDGVVYASNPTVSPSEPSTEEFTTVIAVPEM